MLVLTVLILLNETCFANDLDDGIPIDSDIPHSDSIKTDINDINTFGMAAFLLVPIVKGYFKRDKTKAKVVNATFIK